MAENAEDVCRRAGALVSERSSDERVWRECFLYVDPYRAGGFQSETMTSEQAQAQQALLVDSTGPDSYRMLAASIKQGVVPSNSRWFGMDVVESTDEERRWFDGASETLWENIHNSNFDAEAFEACLDMTAAGWFVLFIDDDRERGGFAFTCYPLSECYLGSTRADGRADILVRKFKLTAEQAMGAYGDKLSEQTKKLAKDKPGEFVEFLLEIRPRAKKDVRPGAVMAKHLPFQSTHVEVGVQRVVRESGYHECPFVAPRWKRLRPNCAYGVGPTAVALPDMKTLNMLVRLELAAADLAVSGMWIAEDDGVFNPRAMKVGARKVIVANSVDSVKPLTTGSDFNVAFTIRADLQRSIRKVMLSDQLEPKDGPTMTATEVHVRVDLIRQLLGPVWGRMQPEWLQPMVERCFGLGFRAGIFPPPPPSLADRDYFVTYVSPMARAQKLQDVTAMDRFEMALAAAAELTPEILDLYDIDAAGRKRAELLGVPQDTLRDAKAVKKLRAAREEQQKAQQQQAIVQEGAVAAAQEGGKRMGAGVSSPTVH